MVEKISLHVGQAGVQIGYSVWSLLTYEEGITKRGFDEYAQDDVVHDVCFQEKADGKWIPRTMFLDSEKVVIDEKICGSDMGSIFAEEFQISCYEDSANCYARGKFSNYLEMQEDCMVAVRRLSEQCNRLTSLTQFGSFNGGCGSGTANAFLTTVRDMFPKTQLNAHTILAAKDTVDIITQPYNNVLGFAEGNSLVDARYCYDNQTMSQRIQHIMKAAFKPVNHGSMNHLIAMVYSTLTASPRFMSSDTEPTMGINLTPFPSLCMTTPALVPLGHPRSRCLLTEYSITYDAFLSNHEMTNVDFLTVTGRYVSCVLLYRGNVQLKRVSDAIHEMRTNRQIMFVDWIPTGVKVAATSKRLTHDEDNQHFNNPMKSVLKISNHTSLFSDIVTPILQNFSKLFSNRSYVHWYVTEGMTEGEFIEAEENLQAADATYRALLQGVEEEDVDP